MLDGIQQLCKSSDFRCIIMVLLDKFMLTPSYSVEQATCMKALLGLPLTVTGFEDGTLCVVYWEEHQKPRVKQTLQIFQSAVEDIL